MSGIAQVDRDGFEVVDADGLVLDDDCARAEGCGCGGPCAVYLRYDLCPVRPGDRECVGAAPQTIWFCEGTLCEFPPGQPLTPTVFYGGLCYTRADEPVPAAELPPDAVVVTADFTCGAAGCSDAACAPCAPNVGPCPPGCARTTMLQPECPEPPNVDPLTVPRICCCCPRSYQQSTDFSFVGELTSVQDGLLQTVKLSITGKGTRSCGPGGCGPWLGGAAGQAAGFLRYHLEYGGPNAPDDIDIPDWAGLPFRDCGQGVRVRDFSWLGDWFSATPWLWACVDNGPLPANVTDFSATQSNGCNAATVTLRSTITLGPADGVVPPNSREFKTTFRAQFNTVPLDGCSGPCPRVPGAGGRAGGGLAGGLAGVFETGLARLRVLAGGLAGVLRPPPPAAPTPLL